MKQREIKFRVWDGKEMREPPPLNEWDMEDGMFWVEYCDNPIMQYTGMKDADGSDIYEGDIIHHNSENGPVLGVEWGEEDGGWVALRRTGTLSGVVLNESYAGRCVIIGNIHQNPELLTPNNQTT